MKGRFVSLALSLTLFVAVDVSHAQDTARGQAFGTTLELLGTNIVDQSDTGVKTAPNAANTPNPNAFDGNAAGAQLPAAPLAEVVTGPSRTRGCSSSTGCPNLFPTPAPGDALDPTLANKQFVFSEAGNATASVLIGQAMGQNVVDVVSNGSTALVACAPNAAPTATADSHVDALVVAGNVVPVPGTQPPNTTIVAPQLPLIVLNEQFCPDPAAPAGTTRCIVNAAHIELVQAGEVLDLRVSGSTAEVTSPNCQGPGPGGCGPNLGNSKKESQILQADRTTPKNPQTPAVGDPIRFTVSAVNSAATSDSCTADQQTGHNLRVIDRIPLGVTVDQASITVQTDNGAPTPTTGTIANCPDLQFVGCEPEPASDTSRQCLTVNAGDLGPQQTKKVSFIATVNSTATGGNSAGCDTSGQGRGICNVALIQVDEVQNPSGTPRTSSIVCPKAGAAGDLLKTTGGGGCSLGASPRAAVSEGWPVALVGLLLAARQWRRRAARH
jgi:uncharacterized repeat protein (TIGR01451 family)